MSETEWVWMKHPDIKAEPAKVTKTAYEEVWQAMGWTMVDPSEAPSEVPTEDVPNTTSDDTHTLFSQISEGLADDGDEDDPEEVN